MLEQQIDLWDLDCDVRCITTNGTVTPRGNIMGGGCAGEAARRYPWLPGHHGDLITLHGVHVFLVPATLVMFPTKRTIKENADLKLINQSVLELSVLADLYNWQRIGLPRPGAGLGGLRWQEVREEIKWLDNRFIIVDYPK